MASDIVPAGQGSYKISVPTNTIPVSTATIPATKDIPTQTMRVPDLGVAETRANQLASEYCAKMNKSMVVAGGGFDMGSGLTLIFRCVSP
jgi:hypothetical protein